MGGGAAGITLAVELIDSGLDIILLEAGGEFYDMESQSLYKSGCSNEYYPQHDASRLRYFGGSSNHWAGSCAPLSEIDFEKRDWVPDSGWPISRKDLDPYYKRAHTHLGLGPYQYDAEFWKNISDIKPALPDSGFLINRINQHSIVRHAYHYKEQLESASNLRVILNANVTNIYESRPIGKIERIDFKVLNGISGVVESEDYILSMGGLENSRMLLLSNSVSKNGIGNEHDMLGRYYMDHPVLETLYVFPTEHWPDDFANVSRKDSVTVSLSMELTKQTLAKNRMVNARLPLVEMSKYQVSEGIDSVHQLLDSFNDKGEVSSYFKHLKNIASDMDMILEGISRKLLDDSLFDDSTSFGGYLIDAMIEQVPTIGNRVTLSDEIDSLGLKKLYLNWELSDFDLTNIKEIERKVAFEFVKAGIGTVRSYLGKEDETGRGLRDQLSFGYHHMGGTRMSNNHDKGVVDKNQKVFNRKNLYVAGSSVFPTGGHVPPTLTIVAMTIRLADYIKKSRGKS